MMIDWHQQIHLPVDPKWITISDNLIIPFNASGNFHPEYEGYPYGQTVKQADTILMGYPAMAPMVEQVRRNDLTYYEEVTDIDGMLSTLMTRLAYCFILRSKVRPCHGACLRSDGLRWASTAWARSTLMRAISMTLRHVRWIVLLKCSADLARFFEYRRNLNLPFNAWQETLSGGCPHFITGSLFSAPPLK